MFCAMSLDFSVYLVTDHGVAADRLLEAIVTQAVEGGATFVQLRMKGAPKSEITTLARKLLPIVRASSAKLIINDHVDIAKEVQADGVHVGQSDTSALEARRLLGEDMILGVSASTVEEAEAAEAAGANYIGVGPVYPTKTKKDAVPPIGLAKLAKIVNSVSIPTVAIGGIRQDNALEIFAAGASGVAVISAIMAREDADVAAKELRQIADIHFAKANKPVEGLTNHAKPST